MIRHQQERLHVVTCLNCRSHRRRCRTAPAANAARSRTCGDHSRGHRRHRRRGRPPHRIRVPEGWTGQGHAIAIGRPALPGEAFNATVALNAERPGGPLHCAGLHGLHAEEAARTVRERGYRVIWRTQQRGLSGTEHADVEPPAEYWITDAIWHSQQEIMLFAEARQPHPRDSVAAELASRGCDEAAR